MDYGNYKSLVKIPKESPSYPEESEFVLAMINTMVEDAFNAGNKQIVLDTNIRGEFPLDNINKLAAPLIESWAATVFGDIAQVSGNEFNLINVEVGVNRTDLADVILQFKRTDLNQPNPNYTTGNVDIKSTADTIKNSGKRPNITSFGKIRTAYLEDPNFIFVILSIKYHPYSETNPVTGMAKGIIDLHDFTSYDFKYLSEHDFSINPALGTGQIQINDIHYVEVTPRTTWELIQVLDQKYVNSSKRTFEAWVAEAEKRKWIK